jgi:hypothetical protein
MSPFYHIVLLDAANLNSSPSFSANNLARKLLYPFYPVRAMLNCARMASHIESMKKSSRRDHPSESTHATTRARANGKGDGRWEFTANGRLFPVGSTDSVRRAAYWTAGGELRFLPL